MPQPLQERVQEGLAAWREFYALSKEIAEIKMADLNANDVEAAMKIIAGTARNMGITIG